ncbi:hypothetical protein LJC26_05955 [Desulfovibrio sp. OttesenSCG-928-O18]|nr:hypothetical protein [Desulfovibrio sp. OttesenSCG-928-O18]
MPTTNSTFSGRNANAASAQGVLTVPTPAAGDTLSLTMVPGSGLHLSFNPDQATASRSGNDLTFELDNGGSVTITDFFVVGEGGQLPTLILPDGEEVPAAVALAGGDMDLSTAAGPAAGSDPGSGINAYADDPGSLIDGISRLGSLGTIYWTRETEVPEAYSDFEYPGGSFGLDDMTDLGGLIGLVGGAYEDGLPYQNLGDRESFMPGQLIFTFTPTGTTVVDGIHLSGFPKDTVIIFGDPNDPDSPRVTVSGPNQVLDFSEQDFADGVYFVPPKNSDDDFTIRVEVDIHAESSGISDTITGSTKVVVDAVADRPNLGKDIDAVADSSNHVSDKTASEEKYDDGFNEVKNTVTASEKGGGATVTVTVQATFDDYEDGSEHHYLLIQTNDHLSLDPDSLPKGYSYTGTIIVDGVEYHQIEVDSSVIDAGSGTVTLPVEFETTGDAKEKVGEDEEFDLKVGAYAEEDVDPKGEIDLDNNTAHIVTEDGKGANATVDVVNSTLTVNAGWAYEGNDGSKHVNGGYTPDHGTMDSGAGVADTSTNEDGSPIRIGLDAGTSEGSDEFITSVELTFDKGRGDLCVNGEAVYDGMEVPGEDGLTYTFAVNQETGAVTITVENGHVSNLNDLNMTYRPSADSHDDTDVNMSYKVTVKNEAGATGVYEGKTEVVIDAVADKPVDLDGSAGYGEGQSAALPGQTVDLTFEATFPDTDGSETHTLFIRVDGNNGSAKHGYGDHLITGDRIGAVNGIAGSNVLNSNGDYLELTIPPLSEFTDGSYTFEDLGITVTYNADGSYTVTGVEVTLPDLETLTDGKTGNGELNDDTGDTSMNFGSVAWAHENANKSGSDAGNNEHDTKNNDAFTSGNTKVEIATVGGGSDDFILGGGPGFENNLPHNNEAKDPANPAAPENNEVAADGIALTITWDFDDSSEYVSELFITVPLDRYGNPVGEIHHGDDVYTADENGVIRIPVSGADGKTGFDEGELVFVPTGHDSGEVKLDVSATINDGRSTDCETKEIGEIDLTVDAVANRSGEVDGTAVYEGKNTAVATDDSVTISVGTTFSDNDGSERHYVLVQQQPYWEGEYEVGYYDLDGDGTKEPYFKVPVPSAPPVGAGDDYAGDDQHLSMDDWNTLLETGTVTTDNGVTITIPKVDGKYDPSGDWDVTVKVELDPPSLGEGTHTIGTGSLAEEHDITHSTENWNDAYKNNNVAMRPGDPVEFEVNNTEGISVETGFLYEAGENYAKGEEQNGAIHIEPSSKDDSFYGDLTVSIPSGHGELYYDGEQLTQGGGSNTDGSYPVTLADKDGNDVPGKLVVTDDGENLTVTFVPNDPKAPYAGLDLEAGLAADNHSDTDIDVSVKGNLVNDKSGQHTAGVPGGGEVLVDAVAQAPEKIDADVADYEALVPGASTGATVTVTAQFDDLEDGSESHFFLLEAKAGHSYTFTVDGETHTVNVTSDWPTVVGPDGKLYYKVPASPDGSGNASLDVTVKVTQPYFGPDESNINYGAMSEDKPSDEGEKTYDNNIVIDVDKSVTIDVNLGNGGDDPVSVDIAFENNTPNAYTGDTTPQYAQINLPDDADKIRLNPGEGSILLKEGDSYIELEADENGWVTVPEGREGDIYYKVPEDSYSDKDLSLDYEITGGTHDGAKGNEPVYVDAVAQQGEVESAGVKTGTGPDGAYTHAGDGPVTVTVNLTGFDDPDPETSYYVLVQAKPGWECLEEDAELVLIDGEAYYRVPVDASQIVDGEVTVDIKMKTPETGADGTVHEDLKVGSVVVDTPSDLGEYDMKNNVAVNVDGKVTIDKSVAQPNLVLTVGAGYEDNLGDPAPISVSNVGAHDEVTELTFGVDSAQGVFTYDGNVIGENGYSDEFITITVNEVGGKTVITVTATPPSSGFSENDLKGYVNDRLGVAPAEGNTSSEDIKIEWGYDVRDTLSGDTAGKENQEKTVVIDAVAHEPKVTEYEVDYGAGRQAAEPGDSVTVKGKVEFTNIGDETNYVLVQLTPGWEVDGITLTVNGESIHFTGDEVKAMDIFYPDGTGSGGGYYKVPLQNDEKTLDPGVGEGAKYEVQVEVETKVPEKGINGDTEGKLGIGGAAVDTYGDGETTLSNNVASDKADTDADGNGINIGIVDSKGMEAEQTGETPEEGVASIGVEITLVGGNNDVITELTLTTPDPDAGEFWYDGEKLSYGEGGKVTLPPEGAGEDWVFDTSKLEFRPNGTYGGELTVKVEATVTDEKSGATKGGFEADLNIEVTPVATQPTGLEAESKFSETDGGVWTLALSAAFADVDGSEEHFFLVKIPDGLNLVGGYDGLTQVAGPDGETYWKIPVDSKDANPSVELEFTADSTWDGVSGVEYHAGAAENGKTEYAEAPLDGNVNSPADDGAFSYRTEEVSGNVDFSGVGENLHIHGSEEGDSIIGGQGNDVIDAGAGDDVIEGTAGNNVIIGGAGDDTMTGGTGEDVFFWDLSHFGTDKAAQDTVINFEYGKDTLQFDNVFGDDLSFENVEDILDFLNEGNGEFGDGSLRLEGENCTVTAEFGENGVILNIDANGAQQNIEVSFAGTEYQAPTTVDQAAEILTYLISQGAV